MKIRQRLAAALAVLLIMSNRSPAYTVKADRLLLETAMAQGNAMVPATPPSQELTTAQETLFIEEKESAPPSREISVKEGETGTKAEENLSSDEISIQNPPADSYTESSAPSGEASSQNPPAVDQTDNPAPSGEASFQEPSAVDQTDNPTPSDETFFQEPLADGQTDNSTPSDEAPSQEPSADSQAENPIYSDDASYQEAAGAEEEKIASPSDASHQEPSSAGEDHSDLPIPDEAPMFSAYIDLGPQGYRVKGIFTEFTPDITDIQPMYSLDGETYMACGVWEFTWLGADDETRLIFLQSQDFLRANMEPLKSYLAGTIDYFWLKLRLTKENGITYETQAAVIDRGGPQPLPEEITPIAAFASSMSVSEWNPFPIRRYRYGRYQLTIQADATPEDVAAYLPDTLPINIQLQKADTFFTECVIDCPVTWKPLSLPGLTPGESVTIPDAAEEITIPADTVLNTPMGIFVLTESLTIHEYDLTDEVQLVLNVISENDEPSGMLMEENSGLHMAFSPKPTGAAAIRAYTLSAGDTKWTELPDPPLLEALNAHPSAANSGYALVISRDQEPYRSYYEAIVSKDEPTPFLVCLCIESGVYDGRQLILPWPSAYEIPPLLPAITGSGGNLGNAGDGSIDNGTEEGQRPYLPQDSSSYPKGEPGQQPAKHHREEKAYMPGTFAAITHGGPASQESPKASQPSEPESQTPKAGGQETLPGQESESAPDKPETVTQTETAPPESLKAPQPQKPESQAAKAGGQETPEPGSAAVLTVEEEAGIQAESASPETPAANSGLTALSVLPDQKETSDSDAQTRSPLLPVTTAAAIYIVISIRYAGIAKKISNVLRRLLFRKHS